MGNYRKTEVNNNDNQNFNKESYIVSNNDMQNNAMENNYYINKNNNTRSCSKVSNYKCKKDNETQNNYNIERYNDVQNTNMQNNNIQNTNIKNTNMQNTNMQNNNIQNNYVQNNNRENEDWVEKNETGFFREMWYKIEKMVENKFDNFKRINKIDDISNLFETVTQLKKRVGELEDEIKVLKDAVEKTNSFKIQKLEKSVSQYEVGNARIKNENELQLIFNSLLDKIFILRDYIFELPKDKTRIQILKLLSEYYISFLQSNKEFNKKIDLLFICIPNNYKQFISDINLRNKKDNIDELITCIEQYVNDIKSCNMPYVIEWSDDNKTRLARILVREK